ncbi:11285_t:CDS:2 [Funneliformis caledonium]|uniref:11285_t:CDS:1 n=1 Tax=Funneliformis caledonium TaxID=1117310 RepID=A0A9N9F9P3_9GLOM|nr:11285_t:CDS:2 [Funneliformis caledonium]
MPQNLGSEIILLISDFAGISDQAIEPNILQYCANMENSTLIQINTTKIFLFRNVHQIYSFPNVYVPAAIAIYVEVAGTMSSFVTEIGFSNLNGDVCFQADNGYNNCLNFSGDDAEGRSFCSSDGIWCFTLDSFDRIAGSTTYSIMFANRESTLQSSVIK